MVCRVRITTAVAARLLQHRWCVECASPRLQQHYAMQCLLLKWRRCPGDQLLRLLLRQLLLLVQLVVLQLLMLLRLQLLLMLPRLRL